MKHIRIHKQAGQKKDAFRVTNFESIPEFLGGADIHQNEDGSWTIKTDWGESTGFPGKAYWVRYGTKEDGTPDANILTKTEKSYRDYIVCDENGKDIGFLYELDPA